MSSSFSAPNPCLVAILLVCQTRSGSGPQLAFHWPPNPLEQLETPVVNKLATTDDSSDDSESSASTDGGDLRDDIHSDGNASADGNPLLTSHSTRQMRNASQLDSSSDGHEVTKTAILGLEEDGLPPLPDRTWHKRKFELSINDLTFVGRPVFARQDGSWAKRKKSRSRKQRSASPEIDKTTDDDDDSAEGNTTEAGGRLEEANVSCKSELIMFHVVFVMNPPPLEHTHRVKELYDNVIKKFSRALKWTQAHHDYVWQQIDALLAKRHRLISDSDSSDNSVAQELLDISPLAKAIMTIYGATSASRIASVPLTPGVSVSMQIPPVTSTPYLPSLTEPPLPPGLWLTTATETLSQSEGPDKPTALSALELAKSYTLLLKSPPHKIAKDAQMAGNSQASELPKFVAALRPTKSFWKLSNEHHIPIPRIHQFAKHLIDWRRAIAIPPLHQRDTYIVSPNADFSKISEACKSYEAQFPASLPSLPKLLSVLSGIPRPFGSLIPSPDHKDIYMLLLAWLLRNGWVTQLRTFAYVRIDSDIKRHTASRDHDSHTSVSQSFNSSGELHTSQGEIAVPQRPSFVSRQSSEGRSSLKDSTNIKGASLIKSPPRASPEESRWLNHLHNSMLDDDGVFAHLSAAERQELYHYWPMLYKHFDGLTALESIPVREGLKRKVTWDALGKIGLSFDGGIEDEEGNNRAIVVTVRHW